MIREVKLILFMAVITVIAIVFHHSRRKKRNLSLAAYGKELLGIQEDKAGRKPYLDLLRFLAVVLVIVTHSMDPAAVSMMDYKDNLLMEGRAWEGMEAALFWISYSIIKGVASAALVCNLLFIMISGALLLPYRDETPGEFYVKRFSRVLIPLVAYYLAYLFMYGQISFNLPSLWNALKTIISGPNNYVPHFWLVYLLLGLYIAVPFQRWMFKSLPESILEGMAAVVFAGSVFKVVLYVIGCSQPFSSILFSWEGIFFLGYYLTLPCSKKYDRFLLVSGTVSALLMVYIFCVREDASLIAANYSPLTILFASALFMWFRNRKEKKGHRTFRVLRTILQVGNKYSFSILLLHWNVLFVILDKKFRITSMMFGIYGVFLAILVQILATLLISFLITFFFDQTVVFLMQKIWDKLAFLLLNRGAMCGRE